MTEIPNPEKNIDITGPEGETLFWSAKAWLVAESGSQIQARLDEMWVHYRDVTIGYWPSSGRYAWKLLLTLC